MILFSNTKDTRDEASHISLFKMVIDEIQNADGEMLAYLIYGLRRIHELGGKIAIVTATSTAIYQKVIMIKI